MYLFSLPFLLYNTYNAVAMACASKSLMLFSSYQNYDKDVTSRQNNKGELCITLLLKSLTYDLMKE